MYTLASAGHRRSAGGMCVLCAAPAACQGVGCTPWRRLGTGALPVAFARCVLCAALAHACQGVGCTPWCRLGTGAGCADFVAGAALCEPPRADLVAGSALCEPPCALCAALAACQGVGCTPWRRLGAGALPVAFACCVRRCLPRGRMYALASAGHRRWMCRFRGRRSTL